MIRKYAEQEDILIQENYPNLGPEGTRMLLFKHGYERDRGSVAHRAKRLGVKISEEFKEKLRKDIGKAFGNFERLNQAKKDLNKKKQETDTQYDIHKIYKKWR